jgi:dihydroxyacetone kinase-like protein
VTVTTADVVAFVERYAAAVADNKQHLTKLDMAIGDADHGENMDRGFRAVVPKLAEAAEGTPADVLKLVATTLIAKVGGASGPLYGTAFLRASTTLGGRAELDAAAVVEALAAATEGVKARGKADVGDKTMVDAWTPAVEAARAAVEGGEDLSTALDAAADAADAAVEATIPLVARKGRASYLGERSAGHPDPGATSTALLFTALRCKRQE